MDFCDPQRAAADGEGRFLRDSCATAHLHDPCLELRRQFGIVPHTLSCLLAENDKRQGNLAAVLVWHAHNACVRNIRMVQKATLQLCWRDLIASDFHNLLQLVYEEVAPLREEDADLEPIYNKDLPILIDNDGISRANPPEVQRLELFNPIR
jgi:hypothetical protein